jgi:ABC-type dipeptide/oligopeptide/nickel transport system permease component
VAAGVTLGFTRAFAAMRREHVAVIFGIFAQVFVQRTWVQSGSNNSSKVLLSAPKWAVGAVCFAVSYDLLSSFHGGNTGSNPVGDAKSFQWVTLKTPL